MSENKAGCTTTAFQRGPFSVIALCLLVFVISAAECASDQRQPTSTATQESPKPLPTVAPPKVPGGPDPRLQLTITSDKSEYDSLTPIIATVTLSNLSGDMIDLGQTTGFVASELNLTVRRGGANVNLTEWGKCLPRPSADSVYSDAYQISELVLGPKDELVATFDLGRMYDLSYPGIYSISATNRFNESRNGSLYGLKLGTTSPLSIKVDAPDPQTDNSLLIFHSDTGQYVPVPVTLIPSPPK